MKMYSAMQHNIQLKSEHKSIAYGLIDQFPSWH
jgi:hypothetical protein